MQIEEVTLHSLLNAELKTHFEIETNTRVDDGKKKKKLAWNELYYIQSFLSFVSVFNNI